MEARPLSRLKSLLEEGLKVRRRGQEGVTLAHLAAEAGDPASLDLLLEHGAKPDSRSTDDSTPLAWAAKSGRDETAGRLVEARVNLNDARPLSLAIRNGHAGIARLLIEAGADPSLPDRAGDTPLDLAVIYGLPETVELLNSRNGRLGLGSSSLTRTGIGYARDGNTAMLRLVLNLGADPNGIEENQSPLLIASQTGAIGSVDLLLEEGADPNLPNQDRITPLMMAAFQNQPAIVRRLVEAGANPEMEAAGGTTALHMAAHQGHAEVISVLLDRGASPDHRNDDGQSALDVALLRGMAPCASICASHGAFIDIESPNAAQLVAAAIRDDLEPIIQAALGRGWSPELPLVGGRSGFEVADFYEAERTLGLFRERFSVSGTTKVYDVAELTDAPEQTEPVRLVDPRDGSSVVPEARVVVAGIVDEDGAAGFARVTTATDPLLIPAALKAFNLARFTPPRIDGLPVPVRIAVPIVFPESGMRVLGYDEVDDPPRPLENKRIKSASMGYSATGGPVRLQFIIDPAGRVRDPQVFGANGRPIENLNFDRFLEWRYLPGLVDGKPVAVRVVTSSLYLSGEGTEPILGYEPPTSYGYVRSTLGLPPALPSNTP